MKLDLYKKHKAEYATPKKPVLLNVAPAQYLAISGQGEPGGEAFQAAIGALYNVAFTIKMAYKFDGRGDYSVCKLEGLWEDLDAPRVKWKWQLMIRTPDFIGKGELAAARKKLAEKQKGPLVNRVELIALKEGPCVQMLHVGPYTAEQPSIEQMQALVSAQGKKLRGRHHEIYLSDPRRVAPARLKTILRNPVSG